MITLRMHHINCILFYRRKGYSEEFIENMNKIYGELLSNPNTEVKLINKCDDLCTSCPNKSSNDKCNTYDKVRDLDLRTSIEFNLKNNNVYMFRDIVEKIYSIIVKGQILLYLTLLNEL